MSVATPIGEIIRYECHPHGYMVKADRGSFVAYSDYSSLEDRAIPALRSIAANTCCGSCQEAALVARAALAMVSA